MNDVGAAMPNSSSVASRSTTDHDSRTSLLAATAVSPSTGAAHTTEPVSGSGEGLDSRVDEADGRTDELADADVEAEGESSDGPEGDDVIEGDGDDVGVALGELSTVDVGSALTEEVGRSAARPDKDGEFSGEALSYADAEVVGDGTSVGDALTVTDGVAEGVSELDALALDVLDALTVVVTDGELETETIGDAVTEGDGDAVDSTEEATHRAGTSSGASVTAAAGTAPINGVTHTAKAATSTAARRCRPTITAPCPSCRAYKGMPD